MKKTISVALFTVILMTFGLTSDLAKDVAVTIYCKIQPQDCQEK